MSAKAIVGRALRETGAALKQAGGVEVSNELLNCEYSSSSSSDCTVCLYLLACFHDSKIIIYITCVQ